MKMLALRFFTGLLILSTFFACNIDKQTIEHQTILAGEPLILSFEGPEVNETDAENPFTDYRLVVEFANGEESYQVPGYFAADGNPGESGAEKGNIWRAHFMTLTPGEWTYRVFFHKGKNIAIEQDLSKGTPVTLSHTGGSFTVEDKKYAEGAFAGKGHLHVDKNHFRFDDGSYILKVGPNSPENFLAYEDIDGTVAYDTSLQFIKNWEPHIKDWKSGDPTWRDGKGKGIIGAINYLAEKGMNVIYFVSMNIGGDGRDVYPYRDHTDFTRFDCSKLAQWNIIFEHAQRKGIILHFVTQETENELLLDNGDSGFHRQLYYRELIARFGHHPAVIWNLGEENGPASWSPEGQTTQQRKDMANYFQQNDPWNSPVLLHTHAHNLLRDSIIDPLLGFKGIDGLSMQIDHKETIHNEFNRHTKEAIEAGQQWLLTMDEIGKWYAGALPDKDDPGHDTLRQEVLWGSLTAGSAGVEWYFGYNFDHNDLNAQDWRSRDNLWDQTRYAKDFFKELLPYWEMTNQDNLLNDASAYCLAKPGEVYVVYLKDKSKKNKLDLSDDAGSFVIQWYNPKTGKFVGSEPKTIEGQSVIDLKAPEDQDQEDWVALIKKDK